jgi:hypothetical protein
MTEMAVRSGWVLRLWAAYILASVGALAYSAAEIAVNLKIVMLRVGLDLGKSGLGVANRARVGWPELDCHIVEPHVLSFCSMLVRCSSMPTGKNSAVQYADKESAGSTTRGPGVKFSCDRKVNYFVEW